MPLGHTHTRTSKYAAGGERVTLQRSDRPSEVQGHVGRKQGLRRPGDRQEALGSGTCSSPPPLAALYYFLATRITAPQRLASLQVRAACRCLDCDGKSPQVSLSQRSVAKDGTEGASGTGAVAPVSPRDGSVSPRGGNATQPGLMERKAGAVLGLFVADAAAMGLHWCAQAGPPELSLIAPLPSPPERSILALQNP